MSNKVYDVLKWVVIITLPALQTFYGEIAEIWGLPYGVQIPQTINAIQLLLGVCLGLSSIKYFSNSVVDYNVAEDKEEE